MSHITDVRLRIVDLEAMKDACAKLGLQVFEGKTNFKWYGAFQFDTPPSLSGGRDHKTFGQCAHAIGHAGAGPDTGYEIGLVPALDGPGYDLLVDTWGDGHRIVTKAGGAEMNALRREYAVAVATRKANATLGKKGYKVHRKDLAGGRVQLRIKKR